MRKSAPQRPSVKRKPRSRKKTSFLFGSVSRWIGGLFFFLFLLAATYHYREGLAYYFSFQSNTILRENAAKKRLSAVRNVQLLSRHEGKVVGFDVSEYQGDIHWAKVDTLEHKFPLEFVFIRATVGEERADRQFETNWLQAKKNNMLRGAYHYYRPNENSLEQAALFIQTVTLQKGDLPPVLDIEQLPKNQSVDQLKVGLRRWLQRVEKHYKVRPIIYSGESYYTDFLKEEFGDYTFWIANYNFFVEAPSDEWLFWQFTERASVPGIRGNVDINIYNGTPKMLRYLTVN